MTGGQLNLPHAWNHNKIRVMKKKLKAKTETRRRNGPVIKSAESVLSLRWERFVKEVGFEAGVKE